MRSQFIDQVQLLMEIQRIKQTENIFGKSNYTWLCSRRVSFIWMSTKQELQIRNALGKVSSEQKIDVVKKLIKWLDDNPDTAVSKIPEVTLFLLENSYMVNLITQTNFSRMISFRNSLRRFSLMSNRIAPVTLNVNNRAKPNRSVTFNDIPVIYKIST